jgi:hypothetical protein
MLGILALSAAVGPALATTAPFHGAHWSAFSTKDATGCSAGVTNKPHWSRLTGAGSLFVAGHSRTCSGPSRVFGSSATIGSQLQVSVPEYFAIAHSGINVTWDISALLTTAGGVMKNTNCAPTRSNTNINLGYTWQNYTSISYACYGLGSVAISGSTFVDDLTTGVQMGSNNSWSGAANYSGVEIYSSASRYNYSNPSYWSYNSSSAFSLNHSYGARGSLSGQWYPTWFVNGTYVPTDRYLIVTSIEVTANSEAFGFLKSYGSGTGDLLNAPERVALTSITAW